MEKQKLIALHRRDKKKESAFTLLEYCAGAAIIIGTVWTAVNTLGTDMNLFLGRVSAWLNARGTTTGTGAN